MQLDADEDGEPFFKPPILAPAPIQQRNDQIQGEEQQPDQQSGAEHTSGEGRTQHAAAATATAEQEDEVNFQHE